MYVQQEILSQCGNFAVEIPSTSTKKEVVYKVMMPHFSEEEYFFIVFSGVLKKTYCFLLIRVFYASLTKPTDKQKAHFYVTLPDPSKKAVVYNVMQRC